MRVTVCVALTLTLGACASHVRPLGYQPAIKSGTTVIAVALVPAPSGAGCAAKVSRDPAQVRVNKPVLWEVMDLCSPANEGKTHDVVIKFVAGELRDHLNPVDGKDRARVKRGVSDYVRWHVGKKAQRGQYADYEIWRDNDKLDDPRIEVPK
jgi:hypothetical protein